MQYQIGDWVIVHGIVQFKYTSCDVRYPVRTAVVEPFPAQVSGASNRQLGQLHTPGDGQQSYLQCTSTKLVYLVRRGMLNKTIAVLPDDIFPATMQYVLPRLYSTRYPQSKRHCVYLKKLACDAPRWPNGQFRKINQQE